MNGKGSVWFIVVFCVVKLNAKAQTDTLFIEPWKDGHAVYLLPAGAKLPVANEPSTVELPQIPRFRKFTSSFPRRYIPAYALHGEWVMYDPCDGIYEFQSALTDSTWINYYFDEPSAMPLEALEEQDEHRAVFRALQYDWEDPSISTEFNIIITRDSLPGLYFVTFINLVNHAQMTDAFIDLKEAHRFRYLVNACQYQKYVEFSGFDK